MLKRLTGPIGEKQAAQSQDEPEQKPLSIEDQEITRTWGSVGLMKALNEMEAKQKQRRRELEEEQAKYREQERLIFKQTQDGLRQLFEGMRRTSRRNP